MPTGYTTTTSLADSLPSVISRARLVREFEGVMSQLVDRVTLGEGVGTSFREISLAQLTRTAVQETTVLDNPQQIVDTLFTITPSVQQIQTLITDRVAANISKNVFQLLGKLAMNAIVRGKDEDGITALDGATVSLSGAGTTLISGVIRSATRRISSNATEAGAPPYRCVLHGWQLKDIEDELVAGVGTYPIGEGLTARVFKDNFQGMIGAAQVYEDGNITIDSSDDAKGGVFAREALVLVQGRTLKHEVRREPHIGGGANSVFISDESAYGERSAGNWLLEILSDATAPTT